MHHNRLLRLELIGIPLVFLVGSLLHFCFEWSGNWSPLALIAAVNESVWEHMKIGFWPLFFYAILEYCLLKERPENFWFAKTIAFYLLTVTIPVLFYFYTAILGDNYLIIDILIFLIAIAIAQLIGYKLMQSGLQPAQSSVTVFLLLLIILAYSLLTYFPPHCELFKDPVTGGYGITD